MTADELIEILKALPEEKRKLPLFVMSSTGKNRPIRKKEISFAEEQVYLTRLKHEWFLYREKPIYIQADFVENVLFIYL